jgi:hypothetical protein
MLENMSYKLAAFALCFTCILAAEDRTAQPVQVTKTEKLDFPAGGTLHLENSIGEVTIEAWDEPAVEITTTKATKALYNEHKHAKGVASLDRVRITMRRDGSEVAISTQFPRHAVFPWAFPLQDTVNFTLDYHIKVPRTAKLNIRHNAGEVNIDDVTGDIQVTAVQGQISLRLGGDKPRSIDAKADSGSINSWFPGKKSLLPVIFGHRYEQRASAGTQNLKLRIGYGDIILLKEYEPAKS